MEPGASSNPPPGRTLTVILLCIFLWVGAAAFIGLGVWAAARGAGWIALLPAAGALLMAAAGLGLYRMRRWGVALFGLVALLGAVNSFSRAFQGISTSTGVGLALAALNLLVPLVITLFLSYLVLLLWRNAK